MRDIKQDAAALLEKLQVGGTWVETGPTLKDELVLSAVQGNYKEKPVLWFIFTIPTSGGPPAQENVDRLLLEIEAYYKALLEASEELRSWLGKKRVLGHVMASSAHFDIGLGTIINGKIFYE